MRPAIVISGHIMGLAVARALGRMGVPVILLTYHEGDIATACRYLVEAFAVPHPERSEQEFVGWLEQNSQRLGGGVLFPVSDGALVGVSRHKEVLSRHYLVACPSWQVVRTCIDKKEIYALAERHGIPAPKTRLPRSAAEAREQAEAIGYPLLVKPCQSHLYYARFGCKMVRAESAAQVVHSWQQATETGLEVMLQEIIPGDDCQVVNYNAYAARGRSLVEFTAEHVRNGPPWFGSPRVALSRQIPEVLKPGQRMLRALNYSGYACSEFKRDARDGIFKLMEVNPRHNLSTLLSVHCGLNFPWLEYRHLVHGERPQAAPFRQGVYWIEMISDLHNSLRYLGRENYSLGDYLRPYLRPKVFAIYDRQDPRPFIRRWSLLARRGVQALFRRRRRTDGAAEPSKAPAQ
jgi:predicted ATP-grasp superfamily ATP-dependent carboligase